MDQDFEQEDGPQVVELNDVEVRVLGALIEKEWTTPDYYPMTLNGLTAACNQKSNRDPVLALDEAVVLRALDALRSRSLISLVQSAGSRANKYKQRLTDVLELEKLQIAVLCVLMLRGPQTVGEIRGRTTRIHEFADLQECQDVVDGLCDREAGALVVQLPRQAGRKESRYIHLLAGAPEVEESAESAEHERPEAARISLQMEDERIRALEGEVERLDQELQRLREEFAVFRQQFE